MSETLTDPTPGADAAAIAPADVTAADAGSVGAAPTPMVEAERFNGLMSAHQRALSELAAERERRIALETQQQETNTIMPDNDAVLDEVKTLRQELAEQRIATARAEAIARHPEAAPFADMITGKTAAEVEQVAATIAQRVSALGLTSTDPRPTTDPETTPDPTPAPAAVVPTAQPVVTAPVFPGGTTAPSQPQSQAEQLHEALNSGSWDKFWAAKFTAEEQHNLA
jgi:hypothetical protein